jgi:phosphoadenosine phosphosulfate reductase
MLEDKIKYSIDLIKKTEKLALQYSDEGFYLAFSGGKDSQVIYELVKMAGVKFKAYMNLTTIDPPAVLRFVREKYPDVNMIRPKKSFFQYIEKKQLPTRQIRWCCEYLKEGGGANSVVILGIRKAESNKRSKRIELDEDRNCKLNKMLLSPILEWTTKDVWDFIKKHIGFWCELYDYGFRRIGCIGCPMSSYNNKIRDFKFNPRFKYPMIKAINKNIENGKYSNFENADDVFNWWISGKSVKQYMADKTQMKIDFNENIYSKI